MWYVILHNICLHIIFSIADTFSRKNPNIAFLTVFQRTLFMGRLESKEGQRGAEEGQERGHIERGSGNGCFLRKVFRGRDALSG